MLIMGGVTFILMMIALRGIAFKSGTHFAASFGISMCLGMVWPVGVIIALVSFFCSCDDSEEYSV